MNKSPITREQAQKIIVAADEVITALAGTNEDVHPEDSKKMCELWDDLNDRYAPPVVVRELARMALAAMDSEPVAWMHNNNNIGIPAVTFSQKIGHNWMAKFKGVQPLYRHAQQPVVPDAEAVYARLSDHEKWSTSLENVNHVLNACRAAMLQAGNSPAIPDGYVMVPKEPTEAMMLHKSGCQHHAWDDPDCAMRQTRRLVWSHMLAAAPQEVKGE